MRVQIIAALSFGSLLACGSSPAPTAQTPPPPAATASGSTGAATTTSGAPTTATTAAPTTTAAPATTATTADLAIGQPAPDFSATDQDGKPVHLADLKGHPVVVYFYPKDETPGCTKEACSFRDGWVNLQKKGVVVIGISVDTADSHKAFAKNHQLPFVLVSDPKGEIAAKYGVPLDSMKGESYIKRQSFVVAPDGTLKKIYRKVDVTVHAGEIAQDTSS
jgi:thioredoxin-dependent peroxiredoxin